MIKLPKTVMMGPIGEGGMYYQIGSHINVEEEGVKKQGEIDVITVISARTQMIEIIVRGIMVESRNKFSMRVMFSGQYAMYSFTDVTPL